ncbi:MAG: phage tail tape measure protein [Flavipsychrobacter sp.]
MNTSVKYSFEEKGFDKLDKIDRILERFDDNLVSADRHLDKLNRTQLRTNKHIDNFNNIGGRQMQLVDGLATRIPFLGEAAGALVNPYTAAALAVAALGAALFKAGKEAQGWERMMAKINVTAQLSRIELTRLSTKIRDIGDDYITSLIEVPDAFNQIISGIGEVPKSLDILDKSLKASQAGFTDVKLTAEAAVNVMNSVGDVDAKETFDTLFATLRIGKTEFRDIAQYLPKIIPYSNQLGLSFKETAAGFALFTKTGQSAEYSTTLLQNAYKSLADQKKRQQIEKLVKVFDDTGKMRSMVDIVEDMDAKFEGLSDKARIEKLGKLGLDSEAASAFSIYIKNAELFENINKEIQTSSEGVGALETAYNNAANGLNKWDVIQNKLNSKIIALGEKVTPIFDKVADKIIRIIDWIDEAEEHTGVFSAAIETLGKVLGYTIKIATAPLRFMLKQFELIGMAADKLGIKIEGGANLGSKALNFLLRVTKSLFEVAGDVYDILGDIFTFNFGNLKDDFGELKKDITNFAKEEHKVFDVAEPKQYSNFLPGNAPDKMAQYISQTPTNNSNTTTPVVPSAPSAESEMQTIAKGGNQTQNITVRIDKGVSIEQIVMNSVRDVAEIRRIFEEMLTRIERDVSLSIR